MKRPLPLARLVGLLALVVGLLGFQRPATAQAAPTIAADVPAILKAALAKTISATAYQFEQDMWIKGLSPEVASMLGVARPDQEVSLANAVGKRRGKDVHMTLKGALLTFMVGDASKSLEYIEVGGKTYIHGPVPMLGATENKWYVIDGPQDSQSFSDYFTYFNQSLDYNSLENADLSFMKALGKEALHARQCDVYGTTDKSGAAKLFDSAATSGMSSSGFDQIDAAEVKFWVCDDGYVHRIWISIDGAAPGQANQKVGFRIRTALFDYNGNFTIAAPPNPAKLEQPSFQTTPSSGSVSAGEATATVFNGGNIRQKPNMKGQVLGQLHAHQTVLLLEQTADGRWYHVSAPEAVGWVHASLLRVAPAVASRVFVNGEAALAAPVSEKLPATVVNGGNRRAGPSMKAEVLGLVRTGETIQLLAKTKNGAWYYARCRCGALGWVHASLLKVDPMVARKVPVA